MLYTMQGPCAVIQPSVRLVKQEKKRCCHDQGEESNHSDEDLVLKRFERGAAVHSQKMQYCSFI